MGDMARLWTHIVPVWLVTAIGVIIVGLTVSEERRITSMVAVLAASVLVSFVIQVVAYQSGGLVKRLSLAVSGSAILTMVASVVFAVLSVVD
jgi:hypothetical protein